ncbi:MAG: SRPBCC family protein [Maritimibacter sp.]|nr:SRPBCC family protein [Maritimibacter sp.]
MNTLTKIDPHAALDGPTTLVIKRVLPGTMERVWDYLTDSELRSSWLASGAMPLEPGADFELTWNNNDMGDPPAPRAEPVPPHTGACRMIAVDALRSLTFDWLGVGEVTFTLKHHADGVLLTTTHKRLTQGDKQLNVLAGWHGHLDQLLAVLEGRPREDMPTLHARLKAVYAERLAAGKV